MISTREDRTGALRDIRNIPPSKPEKIGLSKKQRAT